MNSVTPSQPFCYAIKNGTDIKLHILVKAPANKMVEFPPEPVKPQIGQTIKYKILIKDLPVNTPYLEDNYKNYEFPASGLDTVQVQTWNFDAGLPETAFIIKTMKIEFEDLNVVGVDGVTLPELEDDKSDAVLDTPYVCTKKTSGNSFTAEIYIRTATEQNFKVDHSGPTGLSTDTESVIENSGAGNPGKDFTTEIRTFGVTNVSGTSGAHSASYTDKNKGKTKKGKTKNRHHTEFPFPMPKPK